MRTIIIAAAVSSMLLTAPCSFGFSSRGENCSKCHTLKKDEAASILKSVLPNARVLDVRVAPFRTMWELDVESDGKKGLVYLDFSKKYVISGSIIDIKTMKNLTKERFAEINKVDVSKIPLKDALVVGEKSAKLRVIVFTDPD